MEEDSSKTIKNDEIKNESDQEEKIVFKPKKRKNLRQVKRTSDDEDEHSTEDPAETM